MIAPTATRIAESILGPIEWIDAVTGFVPCPGKSLHSNASGKRDCRIKLNGAPTVFCVHNSCAGVLAEKNKQLRSEIGKAARRESGVVQKWVPSPSDIQRSKERDRDIILKRRAELTLATIISQNDFGPSDFHAESPHCLDGDASDDGQLLLLNLYSPDDVLWIGALHESGPQWGRNFRTAAQWLSEPLIGQHICPNVFKPGVFSRSAENIAALKYLVVESDALPKDQFCGVIRWVQKVLRLRAIVDTAGRSLHAWFDYPSPETLRELKVILPAMKCDPGLFQIAHTCRMPGAMRDGKRQHLLYLNPEGAR